MKYTKEQIDESVKELVLALLTTAVTATSIKYTMNTYFTKDEPIENKIKAIEIAKDIKQDKKFEAMVDDIQKQYEKEALEDEPSPKIYRGKLPKIYRGKLPKIYTGKIPKAPKTDDITLKQIADFIISNEIYGKDMTDSANKIIFSPHRDDVGLWTVGIGHLIGDGSYNAMIDYVSKHGSKHSVSDIKNLLQKDLEKHFSIVKNKFKKEWDTLSPELKIVLVDISYRGDLINPEGPEEFNFIKNIRSGDFKSASINYLKHEEYRKRKAKNPNDGVVKRMNKNSAIIAGEDSRNQKNNTAMNEK